VSATTLHRLAKRSFAQLVGLPLFDIGRAANLVWIHFGAPRTVTSQIGGKVRIVGEWALHLQCSWRLLERSRLLTGESDLFYPASTEPPGKLVDFDWGRLGANLFDEKIAQFKATRLPNLPPVSRVWLDRMGNVNITFGRRIAVIEVFADATAATELWRLFEPYRETEHTVFTGQGYEA
jgi:hypothetical protein